ncbi:hypothetical protein CHLRE_01g022250v5 [Chlamydomonas reinhardtii]|uniref:Large ribosomal subunit protein uL3m n=1 Tax=Chlamydomonas reinhardtii TaxID=3055 RepID=A0A2K3E681_CHLRE|nr:uncharacterized protein CHLRE_01g022250v5 [Chlamydomonas reinhardtii]PNW88273.1 hypothetical protein CHLRE_01g022250v5 [Chlamydomonas reinhardtii]7PKT_b Chain b, uL3m [Chlamydomonas reinhardtii]
MSATGSSCALPTGIETSGGLPLQENSGDLAAASSAEASDACRAASHGLASTSLRCLATRENHSFPDGWGTLCSQGLAASGLQLQQRRGYGYQPPKPRFPLPDSIASIVEEKTREHRRSAPAPPPAPKLEPRPMTPTSLRTGCIATKAGMTQEWDEHGVRVPLTVLWVDECQVVGLKTRPVHGYNALMLGSGYKRQKCMSPSEAGFFLKAGVPFKKLVAEWQVSEDALVPVGTAIGAAHYVAGQRVDVTGWTKWKGFQGVMRRWGFKGLPASHGVSLSHRAPGSIGNRQDPGKIWKGKKLPGCMGDERRTVHNCLVYKVDAARNLVYLRGQVPGPVGRSVFLRDSRLASPALRASWGLPFPTHVPSAEELKAAPAPGDVSVVPAPDGPGVTAWRNPTDPYLMYREETDYMPVKWKKGE